MPTSLAWLDITNLDLLPAGVRSGGPQSGGSAGTLGFQRSEPAVAPRL